MRTENSKSDWFITIVLCLCPVAFVVLLGAGIYTVIDNHFAEKQAIEESQYKYGDFAIEKSTGAKVPVIQILWSIHKGRYYSVRTNGQEQERFEWELKSVSERSEG